MAVGFYSLRARAPEGAYLRNMRKTRLVQVIEVDESGAKVEDCATSDQFELSRTELMANWRRVWL